MEANNWVLIVEDDDSIADLLMEIVEQSGCPALRARDGAEGLEVVITARRPPALVLLDLMLPRMDGETLCHELRAHCDVPIVVVSGDRPDRVESAARRIGAITSLKKPFDLDALSWLLDRLVPPRKVVRRKRQPARDLVTA